MYQQQVQLLGNPLTLKVSNPDVNQSCNIIGIDNNGEGKSLYVYNVVADALESNKRNIEDLIKEYERQTNIAFKVLIALSDGVIWVLTTVMSIFTSIFGGVGGAGIYGIMFVLIILALLAIAWIYALMVILPLMAISYGTRLWLEQVSKKAIEQLSRDAREVARKSLKGTQDSLQLPENNS
ncbi:MAG: hypothetical protein ACK47N_14315 [Microcystis sp.]|jgi:magnesium-transporting ATPase (P-type)|uniref:Uncharacterized protein n=1 Tax=Microcystis viridis FACHB-1342 TaxID=2692900 RepID=A0ABR8G6W7_MICVR|nr:MULTISPECIES: hypothetical protein [Microcystis]NCQ91340.1 hypothetical protein [Microcystis aeruginosa LG13-13]NCR04523.1 hypothetical protein [Microcystis aeruginosa LG13-03]NCR62784.1 hypothetical protein [Microcystis aeruginosa LG11-05]REJ59622.1 MAG: hypothetical protein DWQ58_01335 [Microcystis aeruginosa TA09]MBD2288111.1 hypothetical protein [Microcystis wesenbergii FACHB-1317]